MSFEWKNYHKLADHIKDGINRVDKEACQRSAVSRVYYAAHCKSRNYHRGRGTFIPKNTGEDHMGLINHLKGLGKTGQSNRLLALFGWRIQCDYHDNVKNIDTVCKNAIKQSQKFLNVYP